MYTFVFVAKINLNTVTLVQEQHDAKIIPHIIIKLLLGNSQYKSMLF